MYQPYQEGVCKMCYMLPFPSTDKETTYGSITSFTSHCYPPIRIHCHRPSRTIRVQVCWLLIHNQVQSLLRSIHLSNNKGSTLRNSVRSVHNTSPWVFSTIHFPPWNTCSSDHGQCNQFSRCLQLFHWQHQEINIVCHERKFYMAIHSPSCPPPMEASGKLGSDQQKSCYWNNLCRV